MESHEIEIALQEYENSTNLDSNPDSQEKHAEVDESSGRGPPQACVFVASLGAASEHALRGHFAKFGKILKVKLFKDKVDKQYAFVQFADIESVDAVMEYAQSQHHYLDGRLLRVERAKVSRTLFVAKMHRSFTNKDLRAAAEEFGPVENVTIIKNNLTNRSKGCGFVKYMYREDAVRALGGLRIKNKKWVVEWATSMNDPEGLGVDQHSVFVGGLNPQRVTREILEARFSKYGAIEYVTLINNVDSTTTDRDSNDSGSPRDAEQSSTNPTTQISATVSKAEANGSHYSLPGGEHLNHTEESRGGETVTHSKLTHVPNSKNAYAFIRFSDPSSGAAAIEHENDQIFLDKRIRVQYCETPEMKYRKKLSKFLATSGAMNNPGYYGTGQFTAVFPAPVPLPIVPPSRMVPSSNVHMFDRIPYSMDTPYMASAVWPDPSLTPLPIKPPHRSSAIPTISGNIAPALPIPLFYSPENALWYYLTQNAEGGFEYVPYSLPNHMRMNPAMAPVFTQVPPHMSPSSDEILFQEQMKGNYVDIDESLSNEMFSLDLESGARRGSVSSVSSSSSTNGHSETGASPQSNDSSSSKSTKHSASRQTNTRHPKRGAPAKRPRDTSSSSSSVS